jgi:hypothetical protein
MSLTESSVMHHKLGIPTYPQIVSEGDSYSLYILLAMLIGCSVSSLHVHTIDLLKGAIASIVLIHH